MLCLVILIAFSATNILALQDDAAGELSYQIVQPGEHSPENEIPFEDLVPNGFSINEGNVSVEKPVLENRVVGGKPAVPGQFPYQISLRLTQTRSHTCGGSIITNRFVITAAHCVYNKYLSELYIIAGSTTLNQGGVVYRLIRGVYHDNYPAKFGYDIALLKVDRTIQYTACIQPIPLQFLGVPSNSGVFLSGWGLTKLPSNILPNNLQYIYLKTIDNAQCVKALFPNTVTNNEICTYTRPGQGACYGDSGGPLVYQGKLAGVVSWGRPCARGSPDVFTKVSSFYLWIQLLLVLL